MSRKKTYTPNQKDEIKKRYEGMIDNINAEKWPLERAQELFINAIILTDQTEERVNDKGSKVTVLKYDFIGEIGRDLKANKDTFNYLVKKFPALDKLYNELHNRVEANCFNNAKKGFIKEATALVNLKSNYRWTDRTQIDISTEKKNIQDLFPDVPEDQ
jgi:hypothetical protein